MGATAGYCRPVQPTNGRMSSWKAHIKRGTPSVEPGTDYYCPIGTPVRAAASGIILEIGTSIIPATGFFVKIGLDDGRSVRYLHLSEIHVSVGQRVQWGEVVGLSGATGYGEADWSWNVAETGGAHVHMTVFPTHRSQYGYISKGHPFTLDPETLMASDQGATSGIDPTLLRRQKEDGMYISGTSFPDVYKIDTVWSKEYPKGQAKMRVCTHWEASYARTGGLVIQGYDTTLTELAKVTGYGLPIPTPREGLEVIKIVDGDNTTYALWGPGYWEDTEGLSKEVEAVVANGWARVYNNAINLTYAEWNDRKAIGTGGRS